MMAWLSNLLGGTAVSAVEAVANIIDKFVETDEDRQAAELLKLKLVENSAMVQAEVNRIEASRRSVFVAGWRPFIGWVCGAGLLFPFIVNPLLQWGFEKPGPVMPMDHLMSLVYALLGLGAYRTVEKISGRAK